MSMLEWVLIVILAGATSAVFIIILFDFYVQFSQGQEERGRNPIPKEMKRPKSPPPSPPPPIK